MSKVWLHLRGLNDTDPDGTWCGARWPAEAIAAKYGIALTSGNWDQSDMGGIFMRLLASNEWVALTGHSHGAWKAVELANAHKKPVMFKFLGLIDYCPFLNPFQQLGPPLPFPDASEYGYTVWQHNSAPTGCKFAPAPNVLCVDATAWTEPRLGHIDFPGFGLASIAGDARVWAQMDMQMAEALQSADVSTLATGGAL